MFEGPFGGDGRNPTKEYEVPTRATMGKVARGTALAVRVQNCKPVPKYQDLAVS